MGALKIIGAAAVIAGIVVFVTAILLSLDFSMAIFGGEVGYFYYFGAGPAERFLLSLLISGILWGPLLLVVGLVLLKVRKEKATISS